MHEKGTGGMTRAQIQETMEDNSGGGYGMFIDQLRTLSAVKFADFMDLGLVTGAKMDASARQQLMFKLSRQNDPNAMNAAAASGA